ncbi:hypothetical protein NDU88_005592 [Pleurodeles waltl]|uniref:Dynein heavy chain ATP-binding dynein motor region domain-containing protein n=1 Tax=Pleurodeles waltl TaxID=8319 RepID=A0AAV7MAX8_PLEWA|nr:hypothetical protein NDU88_005592 [Pleurodeles waltl]
MLVQDSETRICDDQIYTHNIIGRCKCRLGEDDVILCYVYTHVERFTFTGYACSGTECLTALFYKLSIAAGGKKKRDWFVEKVSLGHGFAFPLRHFQLQAVFIGDLYFVLTKQQNNFKIALKHLEDELLTRLSAAQGSFLGDTELVEKLESTKTTAAEIENKVIEGKENEVKINEARELYRPAAARASLLYFVINDLGKINPVYQFSLKAFNAVFHNSIEHAAHSEDVKERVFSLIDSVTYSAFVYTNRGLFEKDKLTFESQAAFQILLRSKEIERHELDFLLRFPVESTYRSPVDFLTTQSWSAVKAIAIMDEFRGLDRDIEGSAKRWKKIVEAESPENERFPQEWKNKTSLQKLIILRALRPDRMTYAVR